MRPSSNRQDAVCRRAAESHHERQGACKIILPGKTVGLGNGVLRPWYIHPHKSCDGVPVTAWIAYSARSRALPGASARLSQ